MRFRHSPAVWREHPSLVAGAISASGISPVPDVGERVAPYLATAQRRLAEASPSEFPEIRAWRRTFAAMGLKPTQYRCASEALLRRLQKEGSLPAVHPLIDLCNHVSASFAIPVGVFDVAHIDGDLAVRHADGSEVYATFGGDVEHPAAGEVVFADDAGRAHARRWTNRQSVSSAVREGTTDVLIVTEALHAGAADDVAALLRALELELAATWAGASRTALLSAQLPVFDAAVT